MLDSVSDHFGYVEFYDSMFRHITSLSERSAVAGLRDFLCDMSVKKDVYAVRISREHPFEFLMTNSMLFQRCLGSVHQKKYLEKFTQIVNIPSNL